MRSGERGSQGTVEKKQRIGDGYFINDKIPEPYGYEIDTREVERDNQREIMKARLLKASGDVMEIEPKNGTDFKLDELHKHLQCSLVEVININQDDIMVVDEEGKLASNNVINVNATMLAQENQAITSWDYIAGDAIVCNRKMIR